MLILEPRRLDDRVIKLQQKNKRLLMEKEILNIEDFNIFCLYINNEWDFDLDPKYIKTKKIIAQTFRLWLNHIPSWIKNIEIDGSFDCSFCGLTTLKNCPKIIHGSFYCNNNKLTTLDDGPTFVGGNYICRYTLVKFKQEYVHSICEVNNLIYV